MSSARDLGEAVAVSFRPASMGDLADLVEIDAGSPQSWSRAAFDAELAHDPATIFVLQSGERVVGLVAIRLQPPEMDIVNVAVREDVRRRGFGRIAVSRVLGLAAEAGVKNVFLEVRESNAAARKLYAGLGFRETQRRRDFYRDPVEDAILMRLDSGSECG